MIFRLTALGGFPVDPGNSTEAFKKPKRAERILEFAFLPRVATTGRHVVSIVHVASLSPKNASLKYGNTSNAQALQ